ncbi:MAG: metallophosphoesterase [Erysipelotrichaceae bacterium]
MNRILKIILAILVFIAIIVGILFYGIYISVGKVSIHYETSVSSKISADMNNVQIAFISDINYNSFMNKERLVPMLEKLNNAHPEVVLFGGDMFDQVDLSIPDAPIQEELTSLLKSIEAPLGKFAVLGEADMTSPEMKETVTRILKNADFELITNSNIQLHNGTKASINLVGVDCADAGSPDIDAAFKNISPENFTLVFTHAPDIIDNFPMNGIDVVLAGHTHGGQVRVPFYTLLSNKPYGEKYNFGKYNLNSTELYVSNGLGTIQVDMRLFSPPQIVIYRLIRSET